MATATVIEIGQVLLRSNTDSHHTSTATNAECIHHFGINTSTWTQHYHYLNGCVCRTLLSVQNSVICYSRRWWPTLATGVVLLASVVRTQCLRATPRRPRSTMVHRLAQSVRRVPPTLDLWALWQWLYSVITRMMRGLPLTTSDKVLCASVIKQFTFLL